MSRIQMNDQPCGISLEILLPLRDCEVSLDNVSHHVNTDIPSLKANLTRKKMFGNPCEEIGQSRTAFHCNVCNTWGSDVHPSCL